MTTQHKTLIRKTYHRLFIDINIMLKDGWHRDGLTTIIDQGSVRKFCQHMIKKPMARTGNILPEDSAAVRLSM